MTGGSSAWRSRLKRARNRSERTIMLLSRVPGVKCRVSSVGCRGGSIRQHDAIESLGIGVNIRDSFGTACAPGRFASVKDTPPAEAGTPYGCLGVFGA